METSQGSIFTEALVFLSISKTFIIAIYSLINLFLIMHFSAIRRNQKERATEREEGEETMKGVKILFMKAEITETLIT